MRLRYALLSLLLSLDLAQAQSVLGLDVGESFIKAALVKPGIPLEIVLTKDSKRKEANAIAFKPGSNPHEFEYQERLYGADAVNLAARYPDAVFPNLKLLLGKEFRDDVKDLYSSRNPALRLFPTGPRDAISFMTSAAPADRDGVFTIEELVAMQLKAVVRQAEEMAGNSKNKIRDVVFAIPAYWKAEEKIALETAAELAGLRVKSLVTDGLAVGINYAVSRTFEVDKPEYHVVYDMGAGSSTATVLKFQGKKVKDVGKFNKTVQDVSVIGFGADEELGGDVLNERMVDILVEEFLKTKKAEKLFGDDAEAEKKVRTNGRTAAKLWREATRTRQVLSANTETYSSVEALYDDVDFRSSKLTRAEFESRIAQYEARVIQPIVDAIAAAKISLTDVNSIILHGGAIRTPFVAKQLEALVGANRISKNVNSDEAAVFGAAFKAASQSGSFKVKEIHTHDTNPHPISIEYLAKQEDSDTVPHPVFDAGAAPGDERTVSIPRNDDFDFIVLHEFPGKWRNKEFVSKVSATNVTASVKKLSEDYKCTTDIKTQILIKLSPKDGIPAATRGWVECDTEEVEDDKKSDEGILDGVKDFFGVGKDKDASASSSSSSSSSSSTSSSSKTTSTKAASGTPTPPKILKKTVTIPLSLTSVKLGKPLLSNDEKSRSLATIAAFDRTDATRRALEEARNSFESYAYSALSHISDTPAFLAAVDESTKETIQKLADEASEWLYGSDESQNLDAVKAKFAELKKVHAPVYQRMKEHETRPEIAAKLRDAIAELEEVFAVIEDPADSADIKKILDDTVSWLDTREEEQTTLEAWKEPVLKVKEMEGKVVALKDRLVKAMEKRMRANIQKKIAEEERKKKEKKEVKEKKEKEAKEKKEQEADGTEEGESAEEEVKGEEEVKEDKTEEKKEKEHVIDEL